MTVRAPAGTTGRLRRWLSARHSLGFEAALVLTLYGVYELARGLVVGNTGEADRHADQLVALERSLHLFVEGKVQHAVDALPVSPASPRTGVPDFATRREGVPHALPGPPRGRTPCASVAVHAAIRAFTRRWRSPSISYACACSSPRSASVVAVRHWQLGGPHSGPTGGPGAARVVRRVPFRSSSRAQPERPLVGGT